MPQDLAPYFQTKRGLLYNLDCLKVLEAMQDRTVDLIFADPPFNLKKEYDNNYDDNKSAEEYLEWCYKWIDECSRVLKVGGAFYIFNIPKWSLCLGAYMLKKLTLMNWISVDMKYSLPIQNRLYPAHYGLLYFIKGKKPGVFNPQRIPLLACRHCGGEVRDYGGYKDKLNPKGLNLSDVWSDIYPVRHSRTKNRKFNELSVKFLDRVISMSSNAGDLVFDPFGGSGTTYAVSELLGRKWIGTEIGNCEVIRDRLTDLRTDEELLQEAHDNKDRLFTEKIRKLRIKNGFWIDRESEVEEEIEPVSVENDFEEKEEEAEEKGIVEEVKQGTLW